MLPEYALSEEEKINLYKWKKVHVTTCKKGNKRILSFTFTPDTVRVNCSCGKSKDITYYGKY